MQYNENNECVSIPPASCNKTGILAKGKCECGANTNSNGTTCECKNGYNNINGVCEKEEVPATPATNTTPETPAAPVEPVAQPIKLTIPADVTFDSGKATLKAGAEQKIATAISKALQGNENAAETKAFKIEITGHTDRVPFKKGSNMTNKKLSEQRAEAIKQLFINAGIREETITSSGIADQECTKSKFKQNAAECRKVDVKITIDSSAAIQQTSSIGELANQLTSK
jgi:flagellar motor protein MotB